MLLSLYSLFLFPSKLSPRNAAGCMCGGRGGGGGGKKVYPQKTQKENDTIKKK